MTLKRPGSSGSQLPPVGAFAMPVRAPLLELNVCKCIECFVSRQYCMVRPIPADNMYPIVHAPVTDT